MAYRGEPPIWADTLRYVNVHIIIIIIIVIIVVIIIVCLDRCFARLKSWILWSYGVKYLNIVYCNCQTL